MKEICFDTSKPDEIGKFCMDFLQIEDAVLPPHELPRYCRVEYTNIARILTGVFVLVWLLVLGEISEIIVKKLPAKLVRSNRWGRGVLFVCTLLSALAALIMSGFDARCGGNKLTHGSFGFGYAVHAIEHLLAIYFAALAWIRANEVDPEDTSDDHQTGDDASSSGYVASSWNVQKELGLCQRSFGSTRA